MSYAFSRWLVCVTLLSGQAVYADDHRHAMPGNLPLTTYTPADHSTISDKLTLKDALQKVLSSSPRLKSAEADLLARMGEHVQAGLGYNPEVNFETENFSGGNPYNGFDSSEITLGVSQVIELGGKRAGRLAVAEQDMALSRLGQSAERLDIIRDTVTAYINAVAAKELLKLTEEQKRLADDLFKEVRKRVEMAREPLIQRSKAEITLSTAALAKERAEREFTHTKHILSSLWGSHALDFELDSKELFMLTPPIDEEEAETHMAENPGLKRYLVNQEKMQAKYALEKAQAVPNPRVNVGVRDFRASDSQAIIAGISIPLPVSNRNQGNIERARQEIGKSESERQSAELMLVNELHEALEKQINAYSQAEKLKTSILPAAEKSFTLSREGYRLGRFPYLEVLDAQRTLFEVKEQHITALKDYHTAKAEIERLTAISTENPVTQEEHHAE